MTKRPARPASRCPTWSGRHERGMAYSARRARLRPSRGIIAAYTSTRPTWSRATWDGRGRRAERPTSWGCPRPGGTSSCAATRRKPKCCDRDRANEAWDYLKKRLKELGLSEAGGVARTKANCLRICEGGPARRRLPGRRVVRPLRPRGARAHPPGTPDRRADRRGVPDRAPAPLTTARDGRRAASVNRVGPTQLEGRDLGVEPLAGGGHHLVGALHGAEGDATGDTRRCTRRSRQAPGRAAGRRRPAP